MAGHVNWWRSLLRRWGVLWILLLYLMDGHGQPFQLGGTFWSAKLQWFGYHLLGMNPLGHSIFFDQDLPKHASAIILSFLGAAAWMVLDHIPDRRESHDPLLREFFQVGARYFLAGAMLHYGMGKIVYEQGYHVSPYEAVRTVGEFRPNMLMWMWLGYSPVYSFFAGMAEFVAGWLLLFRRTATLGALMAAGIMLNITVIDYSFGAHELPSYWANVLLALGVFLAAGDWRRLADFFWFHRPVDGSETSRYAPAWERSWRQPWMRRVAPVLKTAVICWITYWACAPEVLSRLAMFDKSELRGAYSVGSFIRDGIQEPPTLADEKRWRIVAIDNTCERLSIRMIDGSVVDFVVQPPQGYPHETGFRRNRSIAQATAGAQGDLDLIEWSNGVPPKVPKFDSARKRTTLHFTHPAPDELTLDGVVEGSTISARLRRLDPANFPVLSQVLRQLWEDKVNVGRLPPR